MHVSERQPSETMGQDAEQVRRSSRLRAAVEALRPVPPARRIPPRRWPGPRLSEASRGILLLAAILAAPCAFLLLLDALGIPPGTVMEFPLVD